MEGVVIELEVQHYRAAFAVLEACEPARSVVELRELLVESLARVYRVRSTTFFVGGSVALACLDPDPLILGITRRMLPEYQERWAPFDVFGLPDSRRALQCSRVASLSELRHLSDGASRYVGQYLHRHDITCAAALSLDLAGDRTALVGLFDRDADRLGPAELASLRLGVRSLSRLARSLPDGVEVAAADSEVGSGAGTLAVLSPRQRDVAVLVADGLGNRAIAEVLSLQEDSVKKYVSRILRASGCRNRTELALLVRAASLR